MLYKKVSPDKIFLGLFLLFLSFIFLTFRDYGISWDEKFHLDLGMTAAETFFDPYAASDLARNVYAVPEETFFAMLYALILKVLQQQENYEALHLIKALFGSLTLIFIYFSFKVISKNNWSAVLAPVLLIFSPRFLGDLFDNHKDIVATLLYSIEIFLAIKILANSSRRQWMWIAALAAISALSFQSRPGLVMITAVTLVLFAKGLPIFKFFRLLILFTVIFLITLFAVDPYVAANGIAGIPLKAKLSVTPVYEAFRLFYEGEIVYAINLPREYLPKFIAITTPIITLVMLIIGTGFMLIKPKTVHILILASLYLPVTTIIIVHPMHFDAWRHLLFLSVPLVMIASIGFNSLLSMVNLKVKWLLVAILVINLGLVAREYILLHPYEYIYFNSLVGGLKGASSRFETDYWGKSVKEATLWLENNLASDPSKEYKIATCTSTFQAEYYLAPNMYTVDEAAADFYICPRAVSDKLPDKKPIHEITREGVAINYIK